MEPPTHLVRCASHKARARLFGAIGRKPQAYWHWQKGSVYGVYEVSDVELPLARSVKGVSHIRGETSSWLICWNMSG